MENNNAKINNEAKSDKMLPVSIIIAGIIIAGAVFYTNINNRIASNQNQQAAVQQAGTADNKENKQDGPRAISEGDHVLGNPNAPLTFILFDDLECPYCKRFHAETQKMIADYGKQGKIKMILRHFPLESIHPDAKLKAETSECVANIGGENKFWEYIDILLGQEEIADTAAAAEKIGIDKNKLNDCVKNKDFSAKVETDINDAIASGARGTPFFVIINEKGEKFVGEGALPYLDPENKGRGLKDMIAQILAGKSE